MKLRSLVPALAAALLLSTFFSSVADAGLLSKLLTPPKLTETGENRVHPQLRLGLTRPDTTIRVIVQKTDSGTLNSVLALLVGGRVLEDFPFIDSFVLELPLGNLSLLANDSRVGYVSPDGAVLRQDAPDSGDSGGTELATAYPATVGATQAWADPAVGATGRGVTVAVIDTGVSSTHPDLTGRVTQVSVASSATGDIHGHGTHVAGIIAGNDPAGAYRGVAPDASIIGVRIANDVGVARESDLIRGLEWVYNNRAAYNIRIVNLSVTAAVPSSYLTSPTSAAAERVWRSGVVVVVASGNDGASADAGWHAPANDPYVITVGCTDDNGTTALDDDSTCSFSSRGTTIEGQTKPDIAAPGRRIVSALTAPDAILAQTFPERVDGTRIRLSGTSMSAPVVAGAAALLLERQPTLTPDQVKWLLVQSSHGYSGQTAPGGMLDVYAALQLAASGPDGSANGGIVPSPGRLLGPLGALLGTIVNLPSAYWDSAYWDSAYWDSAYWDSAYWDSAYWDSAYWDSAYWDNGTFD